VSKNFDSIFIEALTARRTAWRYRHLRGSTLEKRIAECAESIVALLHRAREVNILRLSERLEERSMIIYQAVGWLAREGRVRYEQREKQVYVLLRSDRGADTATSAQSPPP
jgi:hypothetical protein